PIIVATGFIFNNLYNENLNVQLIADKAAMHPNYLAKLFKKETKCTIHEYIQMKKVEEAKLLIAYSEYSLTDIYTLRSEEHTSELQSRFDLVCRLLLEKKTK